MATPTYDPIVSTTLTSSASSVTFSSLDTIAAGYRDLVIVVEAQQVLDSGRLQMYFNSDTTFSSLHSSIYFATPGSIVSANLDTAVNSFYAMGYIDNQSTSTTTAVVQIFDFAKTDRDKSILGRVAGAGGAEFRMGRWDNTAAITTIKFEPQQPAELLATGSTFSIFGVIA